MNLGALSVISEPSGGGIMWKTLEQNELELLKGQIVVFDEFSTKSPIFMSLHESSNQGRGLAHWLNQMED